MNSFRRWLTRQVEKLTQMRDRVSRDPDFYEAELELAGSVLEEAGDRAAKLGLSQLHAESVAATGALPDAVMTFLAKAIQACEGTGNADRDFTPPQVAKMLGVEPSKVRGWIEKGELTASNTSNATAPRWKISQAALDEFRRRRQPVPPPTPAKRQRQPADLIEFV